MNNINGSRSAARPGANSGGGGFFSSFSALFGGNSASDSPSSSSTKTTSIFGSGYPSSSSSSRRTDDTWSLPYNNYQSRSTPSQGGTSRSSSSAYPPVSNYPSGSDSLANLASASTHTLVPQQQGRSSLMEARAATGVSIPSTSFPPLRHTWNRIRTWSEKSYPELKDTLNWPATEAQVDELEYTIQFSLPPAVRESYLCHNGQELESNQSCQDGIFFGLPLLSLEQVATEWNFWRAVDEDPTSGANTQVRQWQSSCPDKWVRPQYSCRGWIPLISDRVGNYIGIDLTPHPSGGGAPGQVIIFGRDFDTKVVMWRGEGEGGWGRFLQYVAEEFENGELWTLEDPSSASEDEDEDGIGYEPYFSNAGGGASRGGGDRGGEGSAGFRLTGEYRGWPVLEAWADRSMRCWEEVGLPSGLSASEEMPPPDVRLDEAQDEGDSSVVVMDSGDAVEVQGAEDHPLREGDGATTLGSPQIQANGRPFSPNLDSPNPNNQHASTFQGPPERRISDTLSPPQPSTKASRQKQKQRELIHQNQNQNLRSRSPSPSPLSSPSTRPRRAPPAPAGPIDLPTIDDVRAVQAAALAEHERSARVQYSDLEHSGGSARNSTSSNSGNAFVGAMSSLSLGRNGTLRAGPNHSPTPGRSSGSYNTKRGSSGAETVELEEQRTSADALRSNDVMMKHSTDSGVLNDVVIDGTSPRVLSPRSSTSTRGNYFENSAPPQSPNLMDISSNPTSPRIKASASAAGSGTNTPTKLSKSTRVSGDEMVGQVANGLGVYSA
ncbi:unnamed protein product [Sympodiomycopsis kandeliae]